MGKRGNSSKQRSRKAKAPVESSKVMIKVPPRPRGIITGNAESEVVKGSNVGELSASALTSAKTLDPPAPSTSDLAGPPAPLDPSAPPPALKPAKWTPLSEHEDIDLVGMIRRGRKRFPPRFYEDILSAIYDAPPELLGLDSIDDLDSGVVGRCATFGALVSSRHYARFGAPHPDIACTMRAMARAGSAGAVTTSSSPVDVPSASIIEETPEPVAVASRRRRSSGPTDKDTEEAKRQWLDRSS